MRRSKIDKSLRSRPVTNRSRTWVGTGAQVIRHVCVCGDCHLATATRIELKRQGIHRDTDYLLPSLRPALVIACADSEADQSFTDTAQQAVEEGSPLLLCCLAGQVVRIGPLIDPSACFKPAGPSQPVSPAVMNGPRAPAPPAMPSMADADHPPLNPHARLGALLISAQALNFLLGARNQCVLDRVVELNPCSIESKGYSLFKVRQ